MINITSTRFENDGRFPAKYTCDDTTKGAINPPLQINGVGENAKSLVLIMDDPDAPGGTWDHWIVFDIPPTLSEIAEGQEPQGSSGVNSWGTTGYGGPCPPTGEHRYVFKVYALDTMLSLPAGSTKSVIENSMRGHILEQAQLIGLYER